MNKIYSDIKSYFEYDKEFKENLKKKISFSFEYYYKSGYLISKFWIDKWKNFCNYEEIKKKYLKYTLLDDKTSILNKIIYHQEKHNLKNDQLKPSEILNYNTKEEFEEFLKKDSLVLIDNNLKSLFKCEGQNYITKYCAMENKIYILNNDLKSEIVNYNTYDNIIFSNENYNLLHINQIIKIIFFQERINNIINSPHKNDNNNNFNNKIYLINKNFINN